MSDADLGGGPVVYLLHFSPPYRHAAHYLGFTEDLAGRLATHRAGRGSPLVAAAIAAGCDVQLARTWADGSRALERRLHLQKNSRLRLCPICREAARRACHTDSSERGG